MTFLINYINHLNLEGLLFSLISKLISLSLLLLFFALAKQLANSFLEKAIFKSLSLSRQSQARKRTLTKLMHNLINYLLYFLLLYWCLSLLNIPVSSLLAGAGIAGVAIGLGAQGFLSDVVNGFFILFENQFEVGDTVSIAGIDGNISSVGIRTTQVRGFDGTLHFIPNRNITVVSNKSRGNMRALIEIPLYSTTDLNQVTTIIEAVNQKELVNYPQIVDKPTILGPQITANGQFSFKVAIFTENGQQYLIYHTFYQKYQAALLKEGIILPTSNTLQIPTK
ncbi:mechanosensitive ion channel family protein [Streptococcus pseudoporcinus]|uniref:Transporter, small conductance mechanosensitive ion channel MscS family protein n=1 Tax=Streptococcus pseudoporcinus LQ 940-04 TaxID=875093 RepID=G5K972_9STRE|nr:mechanosensitive ion channel domain-containing protein [Streptococcus pseudoporcinus]EFR44398.1 transporter, small conductance mechanosensitive ion channel MscS family protein [Streptococcus pseudoporcinus SPIN 20026]EHI64469.1 transporter, small conductance mechanosensitive ion channel MscS family protein [Streptococcus pseudoporcinus LQ 940-04]VEF93547.1 mechanosensitive ion channel protein [Streptococcus pseudoporcinus]